MTYLRIAAIVDDIAELPQAIVEHALPGDVVIDLRGAEEAPRPYANGRRVDISDIEGIAEELPATRRIVICCRSGQRALMAADRLRDKGLDIALVALG